MNGTQDLRLVLHRQAELRREAAEHRLATALKRQTPRSDREPRRILGLRLGFA